MVLFSSFYCLCRRRTQRHHHCLYVWTSPSQLHNFQSVATETVRQFPSNILFFLRKSRNQQLFSIYIPCCYQNFQQDSDTGFPPVGPCTPWIRIFISAWEWENDMRGICNKEDFLHALCIELRLVYCLRILHEFWSPIIKEVLLEF